MSKLTPVTILTGFLGSGKTTLLKRILNERHGMKIAVIENEFGEENIDNEILVQDGREQIVQMSNGCICCTIRGDLVQALSGLLTRRDAGEIDFDRVVIETTGVANPGPVAQTFFMDEEIASRYLLDAVITLVDAKHAHMQLDKQEEAQRQVGFADAIFITKSDLVSGDDVAELRHRLLHMNPRAPIRTANFGETPIDTIFDLRGFNLNEKLELDPEFLRADEHDHDHDHDHEHGEQCGADCGHDHDHGHHHGHGHHHHHHHHTDRIASFVFRSGKPFHYGKLEEFLSGILAVYGEKLLRYKGVLYMEGVDRKVVFQGVHQLMGSDIGAKWGDETPGTKMVFIGVDLPRDAILKGLENCLA
ncbi:GTP-binding protein [Cupriavidus sp. amp6]|uniref:CobW family GTP-binding protein n=1 Tax=Cupriavidus sp. amp6 TaxID=388051 RepID=UPI0004187B23|nr:GTP-binding protein [Cupriavidus sp. amp6]